jgi:hypothetical protein
MKKLFFTAIALVAFSVVSMAKTGDSKTVIELPLIEIDCIKVAIAALDAADPNNEMSPVQANTFYQAMYNACEKSKKGLSQN